MKSPDKNFAIGKATRAGLSVIACTIAGVAGTGAEQDRAKLHRLGTGLIGNA